MRVKMTVGNNTFEFSGFSLATLCAVLKIWRDAIGADAPQSSVDALANKLENQNTDLDAAVAANTPPAPRS